MPESTKNAKLFGSIHGMTQYMIHYGGSADSSQVNIELALSEDTNKVAFASRAAYSCGQTVSPLPPPTLAEGTTGISHFPFLRR